MYATASLYHKDAFADHSLDEHRTADWLAYSRLSDFDRALTPPPDMHSIKPDYYQQEHAYRNDDTVADRQAYKASLASLPPREVSNLNFSRSTAYTEPSSGNISPTFQSSFYGNEGIQEPSQQRRSSQPNAIAPSFQIPKSVNDSGGSLSELAAQITCLFWFESSDLLQQIEDSAVPLLPTRPIVSDAKPSTGFRKWVTTILSTTLVAQNVVILALLFIYRLKKLNPSVRGKPGSEYRLLTVALMLGNKFLDDNTYTNKTWAEVSGINVNEVHIMEVEFLSNMKYCLFTTVDDWTKWQSLLGQFAAYFERATRPQQPIQTAPTLPPTSSLQLPMLLPSPPASNQASPPYTADLGPLGSVYGSISQPGPSPAPSPHPFASAASAIAQNPRKRSYDEQSADTPRKRPMTHQYSSSGQWNRCQPVPRLTLPSLSIPPSQASSGAYAQAASQSQQLPPLNVPTRAMTMVYPGTSGAIQLPQVAALAGSASQPSSQMPSQYHSRQQSPYPGSRTGSPKSALSQTTIPQFPAIQISPNYYLQQRNSPYRPIHNVSTLLYPPPTSALHQRAANIEYDQMHYQPLGKTLQQRQSGRLPYVSQNVWLGGNQPESMTPVAQWPSFMHTRQQQHLIHQQ